MIQISNKKFCLSPMILKVNAQAGSTVYVYVSNNRGDTEGGYSSVSVQLTADSRGAISFDISPIVRDLIANQFVLKNMFGNPFWGNIEVEVEYSSSGEHITFYTLWAESRIESRYSGDLFPLIPYGVKRIASTSLNVWFYNGGNADTAAVRIEPYSGGAVITNTVTIPKGVNNVEITNGATYLTAGRYRVRIDYDEFDLIVEQFCKTPADYNYNNNAAEIRYCNALGGLSDYILQITSDSVKNKATYVPKNTAYDDDGIDSETLPPDRIMTSCQTTRTFKAGKDQLDREEILDLQGILSSPMVAMWRKSPDITEQIYVKDTTVTADYNNLQEITLEFETNNGGF